MVSLNFHCALKIINSRQPRKGSQLGTMVINSKKKIFRSESKNINIRQIIFMIAVFSNTTGGEERKKGIF